MHRDLGHAVELFVAAELMAAGWEVFLPREGARADLVASKDGQTIRIQVKNTSLASRPRRWPARSRQRWREDLVWGSSTQPLSAYEVDCFAFCVFERRIVVLVPRERVMCASYRLGRASVLGLGQGLHWRGATPPKN
jgi:hypothetical protein